MAPRCSGAARISNCSRLKPRPWREPRGSRARRAARACAARRFDANYEPRLDPAASAARWARCVDARDGRPVPGAERWQRTQRSSRLRPARSWTRFAAHRKPRLSAVARSLAGRFDAATRTSGRRVAARRALRARSRRPGRRPESARRRRRGRRSRLRDLSLPRRTPGCRGRNRGAGARSRHRDERSRTHPRRARAARRLVRALGSRTASAGDGAALSRQRRRRTLGRPRSRRAWRGGWGRGARAQRHALVLRRRRVRRSSQLPVASTTSVAAERTGAAAIATGIRVGLDSEAGAAAADLGGRWQAARPSPSLVGMVPRLHR